MRRTEASPAPFATNRSTGVLRALGALGLLLLPLAQASVAQAGSNERNGPDGTTPNPCWGSAAPCQYGQMGTEHRRGFMGQVGPGDTNRIDGGAGSASRGNR